MYSNDRNSLRAIFFNAWQKYKDKAALEPLEQQLIKIILDHPEYHIFLEDSDINQDKDFAEHNPFLHLSLHLAIQEQLTTHRPYGIREVYKKLCEKFDTHEVEHKMMECLAGVLWEAQKTGKMPEEEEYLRRLKTI